MFEEEYLSVASAAGKKVELLKKNPFGYIVASLLAGIYVGIGVLLAYTIGALLSGAIYTKVVMGLAFGVALSLVVMAGGELFTGNNFVMTAGMAHKTVKIKHALLLWLVCWLGNLLGAVVLSLLYYLTGLCKAGAVADFVVSSAVTKMTLPFFELFFRALLCNVLVCLAIWCTFRCKTEAGKLTMIFWCLFAFITTGFEHSVANMTLLTVALLCGSAPGLSFVNWLYNLGVCTLGNMVGGILIALCYLVVSKCRQQKPEPQKTQETTKKD